MAFGLVEPVVDTSGLGEAFGLNIEPSFESGLAGEGEAIGEAAGEASAFLCPRDSAGEADAAGLVAGVGEASAFL